MSSEERVRLRENVDRAGLGRRSTVWRWAPALIASAAVVLVVVWSIKPRVLGFEILEGAHCLREDAPQLAVASSCTTDVLLGLGADRLSLGPGSRIRSLSGALRVLNGRVAFEVAARDEGAQPFRVSVSHGTIAVLGTSFTVWQLESAFGRVVVSGGRVGYSGFDGRREQVAAGEDVSWGRAPPSAVALRPSLPMSPPPAEPLPPKATVGPAHKPDARAVMAQLSQLRGKRRFEDAAELLRETLLHPELNPGIAERFSFELGVVLTDKLKDRVAGCAHWKRHAARYPEGRFQSRAVESYRARCD